ncbi:hypothetical protein ACWT_5842 [Actinoplanes sp. SE50]|uniref:hypothetical protein n=1 Tax=unclassified Actinoplanes TaxID=2626549 RepID=UPI00023EBDBE|nr:MULTISPECIES: hypothetical protein [unclassified Actinoplanes]AEV86860.1 hypothetical protein ACPL_5973 [Actinoplanes sp. SE50/110]ATO85257.1 hypothetical protein ACWT_5842 [Actinoplanes sp. SE50]SLM02667.1 hypothetical protein ACSP50_5949 [Actinoplanes sp. SE50/110]
MNGNISSSSHFQQGDDNTQNFYYFISYGADGEAVRPEAMLGHVRELTPATLEDRDEELAELAEFCFGDEPYMRWEGEPWAGKTALLGFFVLHPPERVDVLHFFIRGGQASWNDSFAFEQVLRAQLQAYLATTDPGTVNPSLLHLDRTDLLDRAVKHAAATGRRLALVVDGIDEDQSRSRATRLPSILSLLPADPSPVLRVILASRHQLDQPTDVVDHPALSCRVRRLSGSARAARLQRAARLELDTLLGMGSLATDVLGFAVASEGGLSIAEVAELSGAEAEKVRETLVNGAGRTLVLTAFPDGGTGFAFSHDSLRLGASEVLGASKMRQYRARIDDWARAYRSLRWPAETPFFLLARYGKRLADAGEVGPLTELARDTSRHARMRDELGGDGPALTEVVSAQALWQLQRDPDLRSAAQLARIRWELTSPNLHMPPELPAVWALLGQPGRGLNLIDALERSPQRTELQQSMIDALLHAGRPDIAAYVASDLPDPEREVALHSVATALLAAGQTDEADGVIGFAAEKCANGIEVVIRYARLRGATYARQFRHPGVREAAFYQVIEGLCEDGRISEAQEVAAEIRDAQVRGLADLTIADAAGHPISPTLHRRVLELAAENPHLSETILATLARCLARAGSYQEAETALLRTADPADAGRPVLAICVEAGSFADAEALAARLARAAHRLSPVNDLCDLLVDADRPDRALALARTLPTAAEQVGRVAAVGARLMSRGDPRGPGVLEEAERLASETGPKGYAHLAILAARMADDALMTRSLRRVPDDALVSVASAIAEGGWESAAMQAVDLLDDPVQEAYVALQLAEAAIEQNRPQVARRAALFAVERRLTGTDFDVDEPDFDATEVDPLDLDEAGVILARAARILATVGDVRAALRVATAADTASRQTTDPERADEDLALVACAEAELGDLEGAEKRIRRIGDKETRREALSQLARLATGKPRADTEASDEDGTGELAARLAEELQGDILQEVTAALVASQRLRLASRLAGRAAEPGERAHALAVVAQGYLEVRDADHADLLAIHALRILPTGESVEHSETAACIATVFLAAGHADRIPAVEQQLRLAWQRAVFHAELAVQTIAGGTLTPDAAVRYIRRAEQIAEALVDPWERCCAFSRLITAWSAVGDAPSVTRMIAAATEAAVGCDGSWMLPEPVVLGIDALLRLDRPEEAARLLQDDAEHTPAMEVYLAEALAEHGHLDAALHFARSLAPERAFTQRWNVFTSGPGGDDVRDQALARIVAVMARDGGRPDDALRIVEEITSPWAKAGAMTDLAVGLARGRRPIRAKQVMAAALALGEWTIPLRGLVVVEPDAIRAAVSQRVIDL